MNGRCLRVGVLTNPRSGGNKEGLSEIRSLLAKHPDVMHREEFTPEGMLDALSEFSRNKVEMVVINGGDGTAHAVLTAISQGEVFATMPLFALLCAGTTSMLPRDVGIQGPPKAALSRVLRWAKNTDVSLTILQRPILKVQRGAGQPSLFGMFFGAGAICAGIKIFHDKDNPMGWRGQLMPTLTMLRLLLAILFKNHDKLPLLLHKISFDACQQEERADLFILVSSLERLFLGMRPYWGEEDGPLYYTAVSARPKYLLKVLWSLFRPGKSRLATFENGYSSHNVQELQLHMNDDFTLDGELYAAGEGPITISTAGPTLFVCSH